MASVEMADMGAEVDSENRRSLLASSFTSSGPDADDMQWGQIEKKEDIAKMVRICSRQEARCLSYVGRTHEESVTWMLESLAVGLCEFPVLIVLYRLCQAWSLLIYLALIVVVVVLIIVYKEDAKSVTWAGTLLLASLFSILIIFPYWILSRQAPEVPDIMHQLKEALQVAFVFFTMCVAIAMAEIGTEMLTDKDKDSSILEPKAIDTLCCIGTLNPGDTVKTLSLQTLSKEYDLAFEQPEDDLAREECRLDKPSHDNEQERTWVFWSSNKFKLGVLIRLSESNFSLPSTNCGRELLPLIRGELTLQKVAWRLLLWCIAALQPTAQYFYSLLFLPDEPQPCFVPLPTGATKASCNIPCYNTFNGYQTNSTDYQRSTCLSFSHYLETLVVFGGAILSAFAYLLILNFFHSACATMDKFESSFKRLTASLDAFYWPSHATFEDVEKEKECLKKGRRTRQVEFLSYMVPVVLTLSDGEGKYLLPWVPEAGSLMQLQKESKGKARGEAGHFAMAASPWEAPSLAWWFRIRVDLLKKLNKETWRVWPGIWAGALLVLALIAECAWRLWSTRGSKIRDEDAVRIIFQIVVYGIGYIVVVAKGSALNAEIQHSLEVMQEYFDSENHPVRKEEAVWLAHAKRNPYQVTIFSWAMDPVQVKSGVVSLGSALAVTLASSGGGLVTSLFPFLHNFSHGS